MDALTGIGSVVAGIIVCALLALAITRDYWR